MGEYRLRCVKCGDLQPVQSLRCPRDDALLRAEYTKRQIVTRNLPGIWRYYDWLPVQGYLKGVGEKSITYKSRMMAAELSLENLYIGFSGYWPEIGAQMSTCSFKDLEAAPTMQRHQETGKGTLVVASAGNTARAFAHVASVTDMPLVLVVPKNALYRLWTTAPTEGKICVVGVDGDYYEAILCADRISSKETFRSEGGARNVARRDGMGTVIIDAALTMKGTPQHYFQAVGSSTGGIAAWEASLRLREDGRFGSSLPKLHLAQNVPCAPIYYSWTGEEETLEGCPQGMYDDVLFNRRPPYLVAGGVADALRGTGGEVYGITNREATEAERLFLDLEGIDILPAAAVAVAALMKAVERNTVDRDDLILLNITGGGVSRLKEEKTLNPLKCDFVARPKDPEDRVLAMVKEVLRGKTA